MYLKISALLLRDLIGRVGRLAERAWDNGRHHAQIGVVGENTPDARFRCHARERRAVVALKIHQYAQIFAENGSVGFARLVCRRQVAPANNSVDEHLRHAADGRDEDDAEFRGLDDAEKKQGRERRCIAKRKSQLKPTAPSGSGCDLHARQRVEDRLRHRSGHCRPDEQGEINSFKHLVVRVSLRAM